MVVVGVGEVVEERVEPVVVMVAAEEKVVAVAVVTVKATMGTKYLSIYKQKHNFVK